MEELTFRPIEPSDAPFLLELYATTRAAEMAIVPWTDVQKAEFVRMQFEAQHQHYTTQYADATFSVVVLDGEPIGRLYVNEFEDEVRIVDITLMPAVRGTGIGTILMKQVFARADTIRKPVRIHVEQFNPALQLYERLGFQKLAEDGVHLLMERPVP